MLTRRTLLVLGTAGVLVARLGLLAHAQSPDQASAFVKQTGEALTAVANGPGSEAQRKADLAAIIERTVDVDGIAKFCLGRFWRTATPQQQQEYTMLFHRVLADNITGHLGSYRGVGFSMGRTAPREGELAVATVITRPNTAPANVQWVVNQAGGQWRIADVVAEGTSLRLTQRNDYASFLARNGNDVQRLVDAMRRQTSG